MTQYYPEDIDLFAHLNQGIRMIDCGAFTGDTLELTLSVFKKRKLSLDYVALMEPDIVLICEQHISSGVFCFF